MFQAAAGKPKAPYRFEFEAFEFLIYFGFRASDFVLAVKQWIHIAFKPLCDKK
jgi:hypothetical protein